MKNIKDKILYSFLLFLFVVVDQASKHFFSGGLNEFRNYVFAFSLPLPLVLIYIIYIFLLALLVAWFYRKQNKTWQTKLGFILILAGAISNIGERIYFGYVRDFIHLFNGVFNLADFIIIAGILFLIFEN